MRAAAVLAVVLVAAQAEADQATVADLDRCLAAVQGTHAPNLMARSGCPDDDAGCRRLSSWEADQNCLVFAADACDFASEDPAECLAAIAGHAAGRAAALRGLLPDPSDIGPGLAPFTELRVVRTLEDYDSGAGGPSGACTPPAGVPEAFCDYMASTATLLEIRSAARALGISPE